MEAILQLFIGEQRAQEILASQVIELIFTILIITFVIAVFVHLALYNKLKKIRNYISETKRMDIDPLRSYKEDFDHRQKEESVKVETFVQEKFSGWRIFGLPVITLIKLIQMTVSIFILIGVLGTFIGLTMSLGSIGGAGDQLVAEVASVLAGLDIAFYTSIAGMSLSLIMTVLIRAANTEYLMTDIMLKVESMLGEQEQNGLGRLIQVSETINSSILQLQETNQQSLQSIESSFKGFQDYTTGLQQSAEDLAKFNVGLSENLKDFAEIFDHVREVTDGFGSATSNLNKNFDQLFQYFKKMDGRNERMASTFDETYEKIKEVSETQMETLHTFEESVTELKDFTSSIVDSQRSVQSEFEKMNRKTHELVDRMEKHNKQFRNIFGENLTSQLSGITTYLSELTRDFDKFGESIVGLPHALQILNDTQAEYKHLLSDRFAELKQFNQEFNNHLKSHLADSMAFENHLKDATSSYEQIGMKNNQLIKEINNTISQMKDSFQHRENQLDSNLDLVKDSLTNYASNLEGVLGDKLDKVVKSIGDYVESTNDAIRKEYRQMREITEESQQKNARYAQQSMSELQQAIQQLNQQLYAFTQEAANFSNQARVGNQ
ncbi:MotA/TolQ/ExbB proton channel family protein [Bacillaceae bacterium S4-13-58]